MPPTGHNEADTRAKLIDPAMHAARWVERVADGERTTHGEIQREQALALRERAKIERKADHGAEADALLIRAAEAERAAREASAKAQAIEDAIYDLKAVNPKERKPGDTRTPTELLDAIEAKGREVDDALAWLRAMMST